MRKQMSKSNWIFILFTLILLVFLIQSFTGINGFSKTAEYERATAVEMAIQKSAIQCYAIEGSYPTLEYLVAHYGLVINEEAYYYHYDTIASNIMPIIEVYKKW